MDTRVILNLPRAPDLGSIPELEGALRTAPTLHGGSPVRRISPVSLIVPTFFNAELKQGSLALLLSGIRESKAIAEIVLAPSDGEGRQFSQLEPLVQGLPIKVVEAPPNNRARSRNLAAAAASHPYLLFLDDDMVPKNWRLADAILSETIEGGFDCALFPRRNYARFPLIFDRACLGETIRLWRAGQSSGDPFLHDPLRDGATDLPMLFCFPGCFTLISKQAFGRLNGFDEGFEGWGFEDTDFALRAIRTLRVLNLFRKSEPFLHLDHPVSPYKSEEHRVNSKKFFASPGVVDVHRFCRSVFTGADFTGEDQKLLGPDIHLRPFEALRQRGIPIGLDEAAFWAGKVAESLMERFSSPIPEFVILHGSRAREEAAEQSDYDLLFLYRGLAQDFFASRGSPRVEIECASLHAFGMLAESPWLFDARGALDLAKIAQGRLLFGSEKQWRHWRGGLIESAAKHGLCYWLLLGLGLRLNDSKHAGLLGRFLRAVDQLIHAAGMPARSISVMTLDELGALAGEVLREQFPAWRAMTGRGEKLFELQIPELWSALHWLAGRHAEPDGRP